MTSMDSGVLLSPVKLWRRAEVLQRPCPVPAEAGVYAWYFNSISSSVPVDRTHRYNGQVLLYVGISPRPPVRERSPSRQTLRNRVRYHYRGNAEGSTLRLTLGCLLSEELGIQLRRVGGGRRLTFGAGEQVLSEWMADHARVCWLTTNTPWQVETNLIHTVYLPLNLDQNTAGEFRTQLSTLRAAHRARARELPIL